MTELLKTYDWLRQLSKSEFYVLKPDTPKILKVAASIGGVITRPVKAGDSTIKKWEKAKKEESFKDLTPRDVKDLCSEADVVFDEAFLNFILTRKERLTRKSLKRITMCFAQKWKAHKNGYGPLMLKLGKLASDDYTNKVNGYINGVGGLDLLSEKACETMLPIIETLNQSFELVLGGTDYALEYRKRLGLNHFKIVIHSERKKREWFYSEVLKDMSRDELMACLDKITQAIQGVKNNSEVKDHFIEFVLTHNHLGDPRLPVTSQNWVPGAVSTDLTIEWLSQADVSFFFEVFINKYEDYQGRKEFWLKYAHEIRGTRVIMSDAEERLHRRELGELENKKINSKILARLTGIGMSGVTAFLMDFGDLKVVEFSKAGHACFFYSKRIPWKYNNRDLFWNEKVFDKDDLKSPACIVDLHHRDGKLDWQSKFTYELSQNGIRKRTR